MDLRNYTSLLRKFCEEMNSENLVQSGAPSSKDVGHNLSERLRKFLAKELKIEIKKGTFGEPDLPQFNTDTKATLFKSEKGGRQWQSSYPYRSPLDLIQLPCNIAIFIWNYKKVEEGNEIWIEYFFYIP